MGQRRKSYYTNIKKGAFTDMYIPETNQLKSKTIAIFVCMCMFNPRLWNNLDIQLRKIVSPETFKRELKTYLYKSVYTC